MDKSISKGRPMIDREGIHNGNEDANDIKLENCVRVYASFRLFSGRYVYVASCVRSVEDYMEVIHHELEVIYWHLYFTKKNTEC
ncbi:hypothetical protein G6F46_004029 [Rhizopus delemar]|uniref:Uncharacterized protein n=2 Tax=Rhizopus TaxID=4842 RepID=A0A9P6Z8Q0_9FUNG|nr:hypothetical protein G6F55_004651 [Rhizopus delemar]KAG1544688.1 hypothetical protein G6F51_005911 [Rhizopus arrhizus]KAG1498273.1 hypothetical protein G6F54_005191 [Rhizopus delemar]KAG1515233.1 hypothetical protein G6F53_003065 [Rhizopus delemar]KAG1526609.1 hypothetical protein G6F52_002274 [Rhizopus delemar]